MDTQDFDTGWHEAIDMVLDVIDKMKDNFDRHTLEELEQRIV